MQQTERYPVQYSNNWFGKPVRNMRIGSLQWTVGVYCALMGALVLVAPHQFDSPQYAPLRTYLTWWGALLLASGAAILSVPLAVLSRPLVVVAHLLSAFALITLAAAFAIKSQWNGTLSYAVLGLGTALAPLLLGEQRNRPRPDHRDLFPLVMGISSILNGLAMLAFPPVLRAPVVDLIPYRIGPHGVAFVAGGLALVFTQFQPSLPRAVVWAAHWLAAGTFLAYGASLLPSHAWTSIAYYLGFGAAIAVLPVLGPRLRLIDLASLRARFSLALAVATALALIMAVSLETDQDERIATERELVEQKVLAMAIAQDVADYINLHRAAVAALALHPNLLQTDPEALRNLLRSINSAYADVFAFGIYNANGDGIAFSNALAPSSVAGYPIFETARRTDGLPLDILASPLTHSPIFVIGAPIREPGGQFTGLVMAEVESTRLADLLDRARVTEDTKACLVDGRGRVIAHPGKTLPASLVDLSGLPQVVQLAGGNSPASLSYSAEGSERIAGTARVPGLGWGVMVERPKAGALAKAWGGRDLAFLILLLVVGIAIVAGVVTAGWLSSPLDALALAVKKLAADDMTAPIPQSSVTEIAQLATAFGEMRDRLASRTAEHERAEEALRESEARFRAVFEQAAIGLVVVDMEGRAVETNPALQKMLGRSMGELRGKPFTEITDPDEEKADLDLYSELLAGKLDHYRMERRYLRKDGQVIWGHMTRSLVRDAWNQPQFTITLVEDITERKRAEEALRFLVESSALLSSNLDYETTLTRVARLAVPYLANCCIVDIFEGGSLSQVAVAGEDPALEELVRKMRRLYPLDPEGHSIIYKVLHTGLSQLVAQLPDSHLVAISTNAEHLEMLRDVGSKSIMVVPMVARERTLGVISFRLSDTGRRYDQTDMAVAEELARRAALAVDNARLYREAYEAISARDEFLAVAAHELKTPITSLRGFAQLIIRQINREGAADPDRVRRALQVVDQQSHKLATLVSQLLDISRIESGKLALDRRITDIASIVEGVIASSLATTSHHIITARIPTKVIAPVDALRFEQVVSNLIDNAIKYSPDGGTIEVDLSMATPETVHLTVTDHGIGVSPEHRPRIFDRFYQAHARGHYGGMGLGLYISREIVNLHGGQLEAEYPPEGGTRLVVRLPIGLDDFPVHRKEVVE